MASRTEDGVLYREHTARKSHYCGWACEDAIEPGTRYVRSTVPPYTEFNSSPHWLSAALHGRSLYDCPRYQD